MTEDEKGPEISKLLESLGEAGPPAAATLDAARESLWSAVVQEMLATGPPGNDQNVERRAAELRRRAGRRRRAGPG